MTAIGFLGSTGHIAAIEAVDSRLAQQVMEAFARDLAGAGLRVAGLVQARIDDPLSGRKRIALKDLATGDHYPISQDLGPGSVACNLDSGALAQACAAVERAARGADLVVVSKFSKQEAARGGLADAFRAAIVAKAPVVTAVSPYFLEEWRSFAGPLARFVEPDVAALRAWWEEARESV